MAAKRGRDEVKIAHNTRLCLRGFGEFPRPIAVRLHDTDIVIFYPDGRVRLSSGGWQSSTTRDRFRRCGFRVYVNGGVAYLWVADHVWTFADGMILHPDGNVHYQNPTTDPDPENVLKRRRRALRAGCALYCESRQSSRWPGGNVPEAFQREVAA